MNPRPSSPFRSIVGLARARRRAPDIERSTFVLCQVEHLTLALPVEQVDRVEPIDVRASRSEVVLPLTADPTSPASSDRDAGERRPRVLMLGTDDWSAQMRVAHVYEVRTMETALVLSAGEAPPMPFVVGQFEREDPSGSSRTVWVVDVARIARWHVAVTANPSTP